MFWQPAADFLSAPALFNFGVYGFGLCSFQPHSTPEVFKQRDFEKSNHRNVSVTNRAKDSLRSIQLKKSNITIDSPGLVLQNSEANFELKANKISGMLSDNSKIFVRHTWEISLRKDETSKISVNDY